MRGVRWFTGAALCAVLAACGGASGGVIQPTADVSSTAPVVAVTTATATTPSITTKASAKPATTTTTATKVRKATSTTPAKRKTTSAKPRATTTTTTTKATVTPGAYCSHKGAKGVSKKGVTYTCKRSATEDRLRWRR